MGDAFLLHELSEFAIAAEKHVYVFSLFRLGNVGKQL